MELAVSLPTAGGGSLSREVFTWRKKKGWWGEWQSLAGSIGAGF